MAAYSRRKRLRGPAVVEQLRFNLRKKDAPSQRRVMRTYGARFRYLSGEPVDPDDPLPGEEEPV
jgi:hypothetical protein